jgi:parallel beta-helix repeat protein
MRKSVTLLLILVFLTASCTTASLPAKAGPKIIAVPDDYPTIQKAIDNASAGDTVFVRKGTYEGNVRVNKPLSLMGEDSQETIVKGRPSRYGPDTTITVQANNVLILGFTVTGNSMGIGFDEFVADDALQVPSGCTVTGNNIENNFEMGITAAYGDNLVISGNNMTRNYFYGVYISSSNSIVSDNNISGNYHAGIVVDSCSNVTVSGNSITGNSDQNITDEYRGGLRLGRDGPFYVYGNNITDNQGYGVEFSTYCNNATVHKNNIVRNSIGVKLFNFPLDGNASLIGSGNVVYHNNLVDNSQQAVVEQTWMYAVNFENYTGGNGTDVVSWDNGKEGNYWSDYQSRYPDASAPFLSGVGDTPYVIDENNVDRYPLMQTVDISNSPFSTILVVAAAAALIITGVALLLYFKKSKR